MSPYQSEHKSAFRRVSSVSWIGSSATLSLFQSKTSPIVVLYNALAQSCTDSFSGGSAEASKDHIGLAAVRLGSAEPRHRRIPSIVSTKSISTSSTSMSDVVLTAASHLRMHSDGADVSTGSKIGFAAFRAGSAEPCLRKMPSAVSSSTWHAPGSQQDTRLPFTSYTSVDSEKSTSTSVSGVVCPDCGVVFTTANHLRMHFRRHTGKQSFHLY